MLAATSGGSRAARKRQRKRQRERKRMVQGDADLGAAPPSAKRPRQGPRERELVLPSHGPHATKPLSTHAAKGSAPQPRGKLPSVALKNKSKGGYADDDADVEVEEEEDDTGKRSAAQPFPVPRAPKSGKSAQKRRPRGGGAGGAPFVISATELADDDDSLRLMQLDAQSVVVDPDIDSGVKASQLMQWVVAPLRREDFYRHYWENQAVVIKRGDRSYFEGWLDVSEMKGFIERHGMRYGEDLDVTNYVNGRRVTLNPPPTSNGEAAMVNAKFVWARFGEGCSLRMPCPQKFSDSMHRLLSSLEEEFGCMVGSNVYLTPAGHQGFAPHWDDVEAFLCQVQGVKLWRIYRPRTESEVLPRVSSKNFSEKDLQTEPDLEVRLEPGDVLYLPRGWIHQAKTLGSEASLHVTLSCMQANCWADFVERLLPEAIRSATQKLRSLRQGLPRDYLDYMGVMNAEDESETTVAVTAASVAAVANSGHAAGSGVASAFSMAAAAQSESVSRGGGASSCSGGASNDGGGSGASGGGFGGTVLYGSDRRRQHFASTLRAHLEAIMEEAMEMLDAMADQMGRRFMSDRLPPPLTPQEEQVTAGGQSDAQITPLTQLRMVRAGAARLVVEEGKAVVYHCMDNARVHHGVPQSPLEFELDDASAIEALLRAYPAAVAVRDLPLGSDDIEDKVAIAVSLFKEGFLAVVDFDEEDCSSYGGAETDDSKAGEAITPPAGRTKAKA